jgi:hypothetical protein
MRRMYQYIVVGGYEQADVLSTHVTDKVLARYFKKGDDVGYHDNASSIYMDRVVLGSMDVSG